MNKIIVKWGAGWDPGEEESKDRGKTHTKSSN